MSKYGPLWLGFILGLIAILLGILNGSDADEGWQLAARWTARASFPLFIITFIASSVAYFFPRPWSKALLRNRRWWGLGFASCFGLHLVALCVFNWRIGDFPPVGLIDAGVLTYTLLLAMVLTSNRTAQRWLGRKWKWLHSTGMWVFLLIFGQPGTGLVPMIYMTVALAALLLRLAAWWHRRPTRLKKAEVKAN